MKKCILLIFSMLICSAVSVAQVREFQIGALKNSIVRTVDGDSMLFYTMDHNGDSWFVLYDESNATTKAFKLDVGLDVKVFDVRIHNNETAYFCGTIDFGGAIGPRGLVGFFNVGNVFSEIENVQYGILYYDEFLQQKLFPTELRRLDLLDSAGRVCMAMTGEADYAGIGRNITTVVSAYYDGSLWHSWALAHKGDVGFTDIACLDRLIVATGTYNADTGCIVKTFQPTLSFPNDYFGLLQTFHLVYGNPAGKVLIAKEDTDTAVIAHFDISSGVSTVLNRLSFDSSNGRPITPSYAMETTPTIYIPYSNSWDMLELTVVEEETFLLQRAYYPIEVGSAIRDWRLQTIVPSSTAIHGWSPYYANQQSLGVTRAMKTSSSAIANPQFLYMHGPNWQTTDTECYLYFQIGVNPGVVTFEEFVLHPIAVVIHPYDATFKPEIMDVPEEIICE